ncbi:ATP synthase F(0) complex subunit C2, mitochondrial-like [Lutra lutra]|uniref:ATP synthase F(0) complex subunit C2, mitochondrial-like n=1 Tax=Lutra lutra TaxID=9657 RepID=UPI001FD51918|nr:ATP synthase F(0) complex subunit C2, mitochondrial-like [Lutra lutra]
MSTCAKLISTGFLVRSTTELLSPPRSAVVLKPLATPADQSLSSWAAPCPLTSLIPRHSFQTSAISRDINTTAKFIRAGAATVGDSCSGAGTGAEFGSLITGDASNPSLKQWFFSYTILGFVLPGAMGLFCLMEAFFILFTMCQSHVHFPQNIGNKSLYYFTALRTGLVCEDWGTGLLSVPDFIVLESRDGRGAGRTLKKEAYNGQGKDLQHGHEHSLHSENYLPRYG